MQSSGKSRDGRSHAPALVSGYSDFDSWDEIPVVSRGCCHQGACERDQVGRLVHHLRAEPCGYSFRIESKRCPNAYRGESLGSRHAIDGCWSKRKNFGKIVYGKGLLARGNGVRDRPFRYFHRGG